MTCENDRFNKNSNVNPTDFIHISQLHVNSIEIEITMYVYVKLFHQHQVMGHYSEID